MNAQDGLDPAVRAILRDARARQTPSKRLAIDPRSLDAAFESARTDGRTPVIAEVKPTAPSTDRRTDVDPVELATAMVDGGAAALSVLTEPTHFGGSLEALDRIRAAVDVPVLRKDFVLEERHLDAVVADVVLLISRFVDDLPGLLDAARDRGFQVLVEVHTERELERALAADATLVGINNRDLGDLTVDLSRFESLATAVPDDVTLVAESGISTPADVERMVAAGADALLIGSAIMAGDPRDRTARLTGVAR